MRSNPKAFRLAPVQRGLTKQEVAVRPNRYGKTRLWLREKSASYAFYAKKSLNP